MVSLRMEVHGCDELLLSASCGLRRDWLVSKFGAEKFEFSETLDRFESVLTTEDGWNASLLLDNLDKILWMKVVLRSTSCPLGLALDSSPGATQHS